MTGQKGFSLTELLVTVGIMATLAAIAIPRYQGYKEKARRSECMTTAPSIMSAARVTQVKSSLIPCSTGIVESGSGTCNTATERMARFPMKNPGDISNFFYTYSVRPAVTVGLTRADLWFPVPTAAVNKFEQNIVPGSLKSQALDMSAFGEIAVACGGKITTTAAVYDEFVLGGGGHWRMIFDELSSTDYSATNGVAYP